MARTSQITTNQQDQKPKTQEELVRQVTERVWELWREDLRHERERRGKTRRS